MIKRINHVGVVVHNLEDTLEIYERILGLKPTTVKTAMERKASVSLGKGCITRVTLFFAFFATGPADLVGALVLRNVEDLAMNTLVRLVSPNSPVTYEPRCAPRYENWIALFGIS